MKTALYELGFLVCGTIGFILFGVAYSILAISHPLLTFCGYSVEIVNNRATIINKS